MKDIHLDGERISQSIKLVSSGVVRMGTIQDIRQAIEQLNHVITGTKESIRKLKLRLEELELEEEYDDRDYIPRSE